MTLDIIGTVIHIVREFAGWCGVIFCNTHSLHPFVYINVGVRESYFRETKHDDDDDK